MLHAGQDELGKDAPMRWSRYLVPAAAVLAWLAAAIALRSPTLGVFDSSAKSTAAVSPACLPSTLEHSARLPGSDIDVSPAPETGTANPDTQISFLGASADEVRAVSVTGSESGAHQGHMREYSQGDGESFISERPFHPGERVLVHAVSGQASAGKPIAFGFRVDTPYPTAKTPTFPNPRAAPADYQSFYTLPGVQAPILTVTVPDRDPAAGEILTTNGPGPGQYGPLIYTPQGRLVWFDRLSAGETAENLSEQTYEGRPVLTWWKGRVLDLGFGQGEDIVMDARYRTIATVPGANGLKADLHDFQIAPHGVAYITAFNPIRCDLKSVEGSARGSIVDTAIQQIDMKTGLVRWEWHSLDHIGAAESEVETPTDTLPWDYFHLNSIDLEPGGDILISARSTWAGYQLEGGTGKVLWRLGGNRSSFKMGPGTTMAWQHDARVLPNGEITFFDDGSNPPIHSQSRALRIKLDLKTHRATLASVYTHPGAPLLAASQGNMQTLADGNTLVGYGGVPAISEYAQGGALLFDAHQPLDMSFYRAFRFPWHGQPLSPPAVLASLNNTGEETIVHASWNGATDVASWRVLAGARAGSLTALATVPATDFEISASLPKKYSYAAVQALDTAGHVLGVSPATRVISYAASFP
jgi:Arylsulfotransferase (ASST)